MSSVLMDILETQLMQRTVSPVAVMSTAPFLRFATLRQDSVNANPTCRDGDVMNVSLKPLACNQEEGVLPATAIPLGPNPLTVMRVVNVGANLESQERNVTAVPTAISTSRKEDAQLVTVPIWVITVIQTLDSAFVLLIPLEKIVLNVHLTPGVTALSLVVRRVIAV